MRSGQLLRQSLIQADVATRSGGGGWSRPDVPLIVHYKHRRVLNLFDLKQQLDNSFIYQNPFATTYSLHTDAELNKVRNGLGKANIEIRNFVEKVEAESRKTVLKRLYQPETHHNNLLLVGIAIMLCENSKKP
jgi:hypothetical protein